MYAFHETRFILSTGDGLDSYWASKRSKPQGCNTFSRLKECLKQSWLCQFIFVIRQEMLISKKFLGQSETFDSIRSLLQYGDLQPIDSWSEVRLTYEKYDTADLQ